MFRETIVLMKCVARQHLFPRGRLVSAVFTSLVVSAAERAGHSERWGRDTLLDHFRKCLDILRHHAECGEPLCPLNTPKVDLLCRPGLGREAYLMEMVKGFCDKYSRMSHAELLEIVAMTK